MTEIAKEGQIYKVSCIKGVTFVRPEYITLTNARKILHIYTKHSALIFKTKFWTVTTLFNRKKEPVGQVKTVKAKILFQSVSDLLYSPEIPTVSVQFKVSS